MTLRKIQLVLFKQQTCPLFAKMSNYTIIIIRYYLQPIFHIGFNFQIQTY